MEEVRAVDKGVSYNWFLMRCRTEAIVNVGLEPELAYDSRGKFGSHSTKRDGRDIFT